MMRRLLVVSHAPSTNTQRMTDAVIRGASHTDLECVMVDCLAPLTAVADDVLASDAVILGTTENFGYMSGALKDFFDRIYYPCLEKTEGLPYALFVKGGNDGTGAQDSVERIVTGLRWRAVQPSLVLSGDFDDTWLASCEELGLAMAAGLDAGIF
jgi:multimeric flavodoxin WrbA